MPQAAIAVSTDDLHGDEDFEELTAGDLDRIEREAVRLTPIKLIDAAWWNSALEGHNTVTAELPYLLARCASLALAYQGAAPSSQQILLDGISVSVLEFCMRIARARAMVESRKDATAALEAGELE